MSAIDFYTNPMSRGRIARWMLEETGVPYETHVLPWGPEGTGSADYRKINPMMKVPAIVHDGKVATEAAAICLYLADRFPDAGLAPPPAERADYYRAVLFAAGPLEHAVTARAMEWDVPEGRSGTVGYGDYARTLNALESMLVDRSYVCGDMFTAADVYVGSAVSWGLQFGTIPTRDAFKAYAERVTAREAWKRAGEIDDALLAAAQG